LGWPATAPSRRIAQPRWNGRYENRRSALLLAPRIGQRFDAIVTGASDKGTWVRILQPPAEGKVVRGFQDLDVGDRVRVELVHTDVERGFVDFARVSG
jgi:exoribonuclease R